MKVSVCNSSTANEFMGPREVAQLQLGGNCCRVLCVDEIVPQHRKPRQGVRPRLLYAPGEVAHFELDGHTYALVVDAPPKYVVAASAANTADTAEGPSDIQSVLTPRELQIVQLVCMGSPAKQVAHLLGISEFTVRSYLKTIYCKLGVRSRGAMVYRYVQAFQRTRP